MQTRDFEFFMDKPDEFAALGEEDKALLYAGGSLQGDTVTEPAAEVPPLEGAESSETPAAATTPTDANDPGSAAAEQPVILARDGKNTIPFEELATARERATQLERENAELAERLKQQTPPAAETVTPPADAPTPPTTIDIDALEDQHFEATLEGDKERAMDLRRQINAEIQRRAELAAVERVSADRDANAAATAAQKAFDDTVAKALADYPFLDIKSDVKNDAAINDVREWRDYRISQGDAPHEALAKAVEKFGPIYSPKTQTAPAVPDAATKAAQAIANAKSSPPKSLSDIPAGTSAHHDEAGALMQMGGSDLMAKFAGKSPEQIEALMAKVI